MYLIISVRLTVNNPDLPAAQTVSLWVSCAFSLSDFQFAVACNSAAKGGWPNVKHLPLRAMGCACSPERQWLPYIIGGMQRFVNQTKCQHSPLQAALLRGHAMPRTCIIKRVVHGEHVFQRHIAHYNVDAANSKPPSAEKISQCSLTSRYTSSGVPKGSVTCVMTPPPQNTISLSHGYSQRTEYGNHALSIGNVDSDCVHEVSLLSTDLQWTNPSLPIADSICLLTRTYRFPRRFYLHKSNAVNEGMAD